MKKNIPLIVLYVVLIFTIAIVCSNVKRTRIYDITTAIITESETVVSTTAPAVTTTRKPETTIITETEMTECEIDISEEEIRLMALVTMAEAEGECEYGKRLVIDTILNRVDSKHFPDMITDVIYQPHQFTSMTNGRVDRCYVRDDIVKLVREEAASRTNYDVIFFRTDHYSEYGTPMMQVENHYFSSY